MLLHDYTDLLTVINELKEEEELERLKLLQKGEVELKELELKIENSGMLKDWNQLKEACRKAGVRLCPYGGYDELEQGPLMTGSDYFSDEGYFWVCMSSGLHWSDFFGFSGKNNKINWKIVHSTNSTLFNRFDDKQKEVNQKIELLNVFLLKYEEYKSIQLKRVFAKMKKMQNTVNDLKAKRQEA